MAHDIRLFEDGLEEYPWRIVILENLALIVWIILGTLISWIFSPAIGMIYVGFAIAMILFVLRKLVCTHCYYFGKRCHVGWGKISALLFKKAEIAEFESCAGIKMAPLVYGLLGMIPIILGVSILVQTFTMFVLVLLLLLIVMVIYSSIIARKVSCSMCKMKIVCPGSASKDL